MTPNEESSKDQPLSAEAQKHENINAAFGRALASPSSSHSQMSPAMMVVLPLTLALIISGVLILLF